MATLTGQQIDGSYQGLIKTTDNGAISGTAKAVTDGLGNATNIEISNTSTNFVSGTVDFTGSTVSGLPSGGAAGLESGTGTDSMQSAAALTTTAADASGTNSIALGEGATASAEGSVAIGESTTADGTDCVAIGRGANSNSESIAIGDGSTNAVQRSIAIGRSATANQNGIAIGNHAENTGVRSISLASCAINTQTNAANDSVMIVPGAYGTRVNAAADGSITIGGANSDLTRQTANAANGIAIGFDTISDASGAVALGEGVTASTADTVSVKALETQTDGGVQIKGDGTNAGKLKLFCEDATGAHNVTLEGPAHAGGATYALKFPNVQSAGTQILEADASGNLAWINTPSGGGGGGTEYTEGQAITPAISVSNYSIPWILSGYGQTAGKAFQLANNIQFIPFYAKAGEAISDFYFRVQNAQAGATMDVGLYKAYTSTVNGFKQTMPEYVADIATGVDVSTTGKKSFTSLNVSLPADAVGGCYWLAFQSDTLGVALTKWSNWVAAERQIYSDIYRGTGVEKTSATFGLPTGQVSLTGSGLSASTDLPIDFAWRYKS